MKPKFEKPQRVFLLLAPVPLPPIRNPPRPSFRSHCRKPEMRASFCMPLLSLDQRAAEAGPGIERGREGTGTRQTMMFWVDGLWSTNVRDEFSPLKCTCFWQDIASFPSIFGRLCWTTCRGEDFFFGLLTGGVVIGGGGSKWVFRWVGEWVSRWHARASTHRVIHLPRPRSILNESCGSSKHDTSSPVSNVRDMEQTTSFLP